MAQIREIKKRLVAVRNIQRITKTMQMIATARFTAALQRAKATQPYTEQIRQLVNEVAAAAGDIDHPLIRDPDPMPGRELLVVITSDRGLCGAYNGHVLRTALGHFRAARDNGLEVDVHAIGKKAAGFFRFQRITVADQQPFGDRTDYDTVNALAERYMDEFTAGRYDAVRVASMRFISSSRQVPEMMQLLPLKAIEPTDEQPQPDGLGATYEFSPSAQDLLTALLPQTVKTLLFQAMNDAAVSEQIMRMVAMKAATENAKDLGRSLVRDYNRARQSQITTELMEVIGGAAALG